ncbi:hypothetical protein A2533_03930 [Candidatus Falkowbacteria bacterium RIFOXYD2_FULL_35_9]|uniref:Dickkopf N-terminal cysteine-rich domain-containing protein n=1 Tax=Candidatus Falkowbacteria bacterium RIFOXYC2_FULL_36_12 TaxID=1798002 RepID=A0A1F5T322_9BACT|nr:MAG: hypothetical protein A2478_01185 [Candidatus Falkowbacteria bacterium RIFOXYC2_FULL_36_12]OGF48574.1 MAG: hypothetical protein A2533_03930 [Candidatus Falkowbacteria bacterium RIFOXYD2_FULL_35_9]
MKNKAKLILFFVFSTIIFGVINVAIIQAADIRELRLNVPIGDLTKFDQPFVGKCSNSLQGDDAECLQIPWISQYIAAFYNYGVRFGAILAVLMLIIGGVMYITAGINPQIVGKAKDMMTYSVLGLVILIGSYVILTSVNPDLSRLPNIEIENIKPVEFVCCQSSADPNDVILETLKGGSAVFNSPLKSLINTAMAESSEGRCSTGRSEVGIERCTTAASIGAPCCTDPNSASYAACRAVGGECTSIGEEKGDCEIAAEFIAESALVMTVAGALPAGLVAKIGQTGWKVAKVGTKTIIKGTIKCAKSKLCITSLVGYSILKETSTETCSGRYGTCQQLAGGLQNGDLCKAKTQCLSGNCCITQKSLGCWGVLMGFCSNGESGPANTQGTGTCDPDRAGISGAVACCQEGATCAKYNAGAGNVFARCSTGQIGHACGEVEKICESNGLICDENSKTCRPELGFVPDGTTAICQSDDACPGGAWCTKSHLGMLCIRNPQRPGCLTADDATCINKFPIGESCQEDFQCLTDNCTGNVCAPVDYTASGCAESGQVSTAEGCKQYNATAVKFTAYNQQCSDHNQCLSGDCSAKLVNGTSVCDCDNNDQCPFGWKCLEVGLNQTCINPAVQLSAGSPCASSVECKSNECKPADPQNPFAGGLCTCNVNSDCSAPNRFCVTDKNDINLCQSGADGQDCEDDDDCLGKCGNRQAEINGIPLPVGRVDKCVTQTTCEPTVQTNCGSLPAYGAGASCQVSNICDCNTDADCESGYICVDVSGGDVCARATVFTP